MEEQVKEQGTQETLFTSEDLQKQIEELKKQNEDLVKEKMRFKNAFDKTASEVAQKNKEAKQFKISAEENEKNHLEEIENFKKEIEMLKMEQLKTKSQKEYIQFGFDEEKAEELAQYQINGEFTNVLKEIQNFMNIKLENSKKEWIKERPSVNKGGQSDDETDDFQKGFKNLIKNGGLTNYGITRK